MNFKNHARHSSYNNLKKKKTWNLKPGCDCPIHPDPLTKNWLRCSFKHFCGESSFYPFICCSFWFVPVRCTRTCCYAFTCMLQRTTINRKINFLINDWLRTIIFRFGCTLLKTVARSIDRTWFIHVDSNTGSDDAILFVSFVRSFVPELIHLLKVSSNRSSCGGSLINRRFCDF